MCHLFCFYSSLTENILLYLTIEGDEVVSDRRKVVAGAWVLSSCQSGKGVAILTRHQNALGFSWGWTAPSFGQC